MTEVRSVSSTGGAKGVKPERFSLIPTRALAWVARMYGRGAEKYHETPDRPNWRKGYEWSKSYDALQRHATQFWGGEDYDEETQMPHMAAVAFHALTILTFMEEHPEFDDRYKGSTTEEQKQSEEALAELRRRLTAPAEPANIVHLRNGYTNTEAREVGWSRT
ncbi:hypothetical protein QCN32_gp39 [Arthrobacter phage Niktson]|uniref:dATP/dGTP diphosphohydrolase N-terminal domain-containing protein n=1 Tax=Arthrobacter phage Niktson TaxID=2014347 RepID=A0A218M5M0_9CAUD|nr:hypothetical protein QCN32_gp39 [Arthrobacter phage Niktson]ASD52264.1 hypothetical protein NIKTSON_39 [Arthrobacter phage Niktson]ASD52357.1 hypothetical protein ELEPHANTMAN_39 [Arthrobacter phage ElephantMan]